MHFHSNLLWFVFPAEFAQTNTVWSVNTDSTCAVSASDSTLKISASSRQVLLHWVCLDEFAFHSFVDLISKTDLFLLLYESSWTKPEDGWTSVMWSQHPIWRHEVTLESLINMFSFCSKVAMRLNYRGNRKGLCSVSWWIIGSCLFPHELAFTPWKTYLQMITVNEACL